MGEGLPHGRATNGDRLQRDLQQPVQSQRHHCHSKPHCMQVARHHSLGWQPDIPGVGAGQSDAAARWEQGAPCIHSHLLDMGDYSKWASKPAWQETRAVADDEKLFFEEVAYNLRENGIDVVIYDDIRRSGG